MEMNQAETAFVTPQGSAWSLRWFTPVAEIDLCGHATLAAAHALWQHHGAPDGPLRFMTRSGVLTAERDDQGMISLDFPALASRPTEAPEHLAATLGAPPEVVLRGPYDLLCVLANAEAVRALTPNLVAMAGWDVRGVIVTAEGEDAGADFVSRFFAPALGVPEDPVTGSAHCALAPYWSERLGRLELTGRQLSHRGGMIRCSVRGPRVSLAGRAITVLAGEVTA
jgi:PhzF family phenazine biosynthesis protein